MGMIEWLHSKSKKETMPILTFPAIQHLGISVEQLVHDSSLQVQAMKYVQDRCDMMAILGLMDLSVEAQAFGATTSCSEEELPTIVGAIVSSQEDVDALVVPKVSENRTQVYVDAISELSKEDLGKPIFPGIIGPFSLAGRLMDVSEAMIYCYEEPEMVHDVLEKVTEFLIEYGTAFKQAGASGVVMAEPLAGILSPGLVQVFSCDYVKKIVDALSDDNFLFIYHNCGNNTVKMVDQLLSFDAPVYHFGNSIDILEILEKFPKNKVIMGNLDPVGLFKDASKQAMIDATKELLEKTKNYPNFFISSGCDIPPNASWENIDAYFETVRGE